MSVTVVVAPASVVGVTAGVVGNPQARDELSDPTYRNGRPVSRTLSTTVDSPVAGIVGHTDSDGSTASNLRLSRQRAGQVGDYLADTYRGLSATAAGRGESQPALRNSSPRNKAANRRVEIYLG